MVAPEVKRKIMLDIVAVAGMSLMAFGFYGLYWPLCPLSVGVALFGGAMWGRRNAP